MKIRKVMTGTKKMRIAHVFSAICAMLAILLLILLFYTPLFNPGRIYYDNDLLFNENDNYQCSATNGTLITPNHENKISSENFSGMRTVYTFVSNVDTQISISWDINVKHGNFKIVLVDLENSKIELVICDGTDSNRIDSYLLSAREYQIRFVGDRANLNGEFYISMDSQ